MHFTYTYVNHDVEKYQGYLDFIFHEIWMKAEVDKPFGPELFEENEELHSIYQRLNVSTSTAALFFCRKTHEIFDEFASLSQNERKRVAEVYAINNSIEQICNDKSIEPLNYDELSNISVPLSTALKSFYGKLYGSKSPFNLAVFGKLSDLAIHDFDRSFMTENDNGICPFCGINHLKGNDHRYREAYDHFLPKSLYPFNSINFHNLAPMCNECNSTYKTIKDPSCDLDPVNNNKERRKAFYPYAAQHPEIEVKVSLNSDNPLKLKPQDVEIEVLSSEQNREEELESWNRVFGITERYKATICSKNDGISWFIDMHEEFANFEELTGVNDPEIYFSIILKSATKNPLNAKGFLKAPFLEDCKAKGLFDHQLNID